MTVVQSKIWLESPLRHDDYPHLCFNHLKAGFGYTGGIDKAEDRAVTNRNLASDTYQAMKPAPVVESFVTLFDDVQVIPPLDPPGWMSNRNQHVIVRRHRNTGYREFHVPCNSLHPFRILEADYVNRLTFVYSVRTL